jgi:thioredoxin reductase (NADPH)
MIRRYDYFKGEKATLDEVEKNPKIEIMYNWDLLDVEGENFVNKAIVKNTKTGQEKELPLDAVFGYIGNEPKTDLFKDYIKLNNMGYAITDHNMETNIKGVYVAGDVREKVYRQITTAVADGTIAALAAEKHIVESSR